MKSGKIIQWTIVVIGLCILAAAAGCGKVWMSQSYRQQVEMSNIVIQSLNRDCQGGDDDACKRGLDESAAIVQLIVDAVHGVDSTSEQGGAGQ